MTAPLGPIGIKALEGRGISPETASRFGIYTARHGDDGTVPDFNGKVVAFPFIERGAVVAEKYRAPGKRFWQRAGGRRTFWNADALEDPQLLTGNMPLIITEGEIDALTAIECGFPLTVSVPDGAPAVPDGEDPEAVGDIDPSAEKAGKFEFLWNNRERLRAIKRFVLAVDNDRPGQRLAAELLRRLGASRCSFVTYPEGCKDLNDVLTRHGRDAVVAVLNTGRPYPVRGLYRLCDYPELPPIEGCDTGWSTLDRHFRPFPGAFTVVTGIPNHGKSTWSLNLFWRLYCRHGWRTALFSPEMPTVPHVRDKLRRIVTGRPLHALHPDQVIAADRAIGDAFVFIDADPVTGEAEGDMSLEWILEKGADAVMRDGINALVIDPWNEVEHAKDPRESMGDYVGRGIRMLKRFARQYEVMTTVIAHPTKEVGKNGEARMPTLYDIADSAHWFNKPDFGLIVHREDRESNETTIDIAKVRFEETGEKGYVRMAFDRDTSRYDVLDTRDFSA